MPYVDGFVLPVPRKNLAAYRRIAAKAGRIWKEYGALEYRECVGEDLAEQLGRCLPAPREGQARRDGRVLVDRLQVARPPRPREREGHEGPADRRR